MKPTKSKHFDKSLIKKSSIAFEMIFSVLIFLTMLLIISNPSKYSNSTINGLTLFINSVLPGLFPFMFLTKLLTELGFVFLLTKKCNLFTNKLFGTSGLSLYAFFMSILSGYPIGSKIISDFYEKNLINQQEAKKMATFCTTSGPIFIIGAVGVGMFKSFKIGLILYFSHIISSMIIGVLYNLIFNKEKKSFSKSTPNILLIKNENIISKCLSETISSLFLVGSYITIFYLFIDICESLKIISILSNALYVLFRHFGFSVETCQNLIFGIIEVTRGCKAFSQNINNLSITLCCGIISFSGLSIIMQSMAFLKNTKIKMHEFVLFKLIHLILSMLLCFLMLTIFI